MQTSYIYSASRVNTLAQYLLTKTDIERLLVTNSVDDLQSALKETYLAPFVMQASSGNMNDAIEETLIDAKRLIHRVAPQGDMFRTLWVQYDIHNLRVFTKALARGLTFEDCEPYLSKRGIYEPIVVYNHIQDNTLNRLQPEWQEAYDAVNRLITAGELDKVDSVYDGVFFATAKRITQMHGDSFMNKYLKGSIDVYNLKSRLRAVTHPEINFDNLFISGGNYAAAEIDSKEHVFSILTMLGGGDGFWHSAVEYYQETGNTTRIDARADEYLLSLAKQASTDMFSSASLVSYYLLCRQSAANVRTIVVGKNSGMKEDDIRANLRLSYVND